MGRLRLKTPRRSTPGYGKADRGRKQKKEEKRGNSGDYEDDVFSTSSTPGIARGSDRQLGLYDGIHGLKDSP